MKRFGGMDGLLKQAQKLQENMARAQAELEQIIVEASAGGGVITVKASGKQEIISIKIDPEVIDPNEVEMLEDLVTAAVNQALKNAKEVADQRMSSVAGGLMGGLPPGFKIPGF
ncbi:MAG: YbaB/EbfC family nucleoid-associated protein [bacterium]|nr:YbaB/EbfC family nucleoid-associated protein [bacterium]